MTRGLFIVFEGGEGAGKSTMMAVAESVLAAAGQSVVTTREPGGTAVGERIRDVLLDPETGDLASNTELLLMFAARAEHLARVIEPALAGGQHVLCDRFTDASYAYQGYGRGESLESIGRLESLVQGELRPDLVILLDIDADLGLQRVHKRGASDRFEQEDRRFFERVRRGYLERAAQAVDRYRVIDASRSEAVVAAEVRAAVELLLSGWRRARD